MTRKLYTKRYLYGNYERMKEQLINGDRTLSQDSFGQSNLGNYSNDITVRVYDDATHIDFDVYDISTNPVKYLDGGTVCTINDLPTNEDDFWPLVEGRIKNHVENLKNK